MDLLIKGLAMPKNGEVLKLYLSDGFVGYQDDNGLHKATVIELPTHGRLIDADALEEYYDNLDADNGEYIESASETAETIHNAPTVLEASK